MKSLTSLLSFAALILSASNAVLAQEARKIQDNSFLIEEAYNQEAGVVQHIQGFQHMEGNAWAYTFTQEWPLSGQRNQLSYTIPVNRDAGVDETGIGDVALNYRRQVLLREGIALAPRFSLLLPTGDCEKGFGRGAVGLQMNMPLSIELSAKWVSHWNWGWTFTPGSQGPSGVEADTLGFNYGASLIWLKSENFNLMLEAAGNSIERVQADGSKKRENTLFLNPGARFAIDLKSGLQIVPGVAIPISIGPAGSQSGVFLYLSLEHPFSQP